MKRYKNWILMIIRTFYYIWLKIMTPSKILIKSQFLYLFTNGYYQLPLVLVSAYITSLKEGSFWPPSPVIFSSKIPAWVALSWINTKMFPQQHSPASMVTLRGQIEKLIVCGFASPLVFLLNGYAYAKNKYR